MLIDENILQMFPVDNTIHLYFWYGFMQPHPGEKTSLLTLNFLRLFQPEYLLFKIGQGGSLYLSSSTSTHHLPTPFTNSNRYLYFCLLVYWSTCTHLSSWSRVFIWRRWIFLGHPFLTALIYRVICVFRVVNSCVRRWGWVLLVLLHLCLRRFLRNFLIRGCRNLFLLFTGRISGGRLWLWRSRLKKGSSSYLLKLFWQRKFIQLRVFRKDK